MHPAVSTIAALALASTAAADIVYDSITGTPRQSSFFSEDELADDTTLSTGLGTIIRQVEVGVEKSSAFPGTYTGTMTVRLWSDAGGSPGSLLRTSVVPITLANSSVHIIPAEFPSITAPTATIWTGVQFSFVAQLGAGIVEGQLNPSVGSTTALRARNQGGTWNVFSLPGIHPFIRINTVPAPSALALLGAPFVIASVRRRRT